MLGLRVIRIFSLTKLTKTTAPKPALSCVKLAPKQSHKRKVSLKKHGKNPQLNLLKLCLFGFCRLGILASQPIETRRCAEKTSWSPPV